MRFVVFGAGGIGSVVGGHLARAGHDVVLVARPGHVEAITKHGLEIIGQDRFRVGVRATATAADLSECDHLIITCKTKDTRAALDSLAHLSVGACCSLQNGMIKDQQLGAAFGWDRVIGACTMIASTRVADGVVEFTGEGPTFLGEPNGSLSVRVGALGRAFRDSGLEAKVVDSMSSIEWTKQALQSSAAPLSALTRLPFHELCLTRPVAELFVAMIRETAAVAERCGVQLSNDPGFGFDLDAVNHRPLDEAVSLIMRRGENLAATGRTNIVSSMLSDVLAGRPTEISETAGYVVREGGRLGVPVPLMTFAYKAVLSVDLANASAVGPTGADPAAKPVFQLAL